MQKLKASKKALILASLLGSYVLAGSVGASNLVLTVPSDYSTSNAVLITGSRVTDAVDQQKGDTLPNLNRDPATYAFRSNGKGMLYLRSYNYSTSSLIPAQIIPTETKDINTVYASGIVTKAANPHSAAGYGNYIYTGDYDLGTIAVSKVSGTSLVEDTSGAVDLLADINKYAGGTYKQTEDTKYAWAHGEALCVKDGNLFVVTSVNPQGGYKPYDDSYLMQYKINTDGSLTYVSHIRSVRNPDSVQLQNYNDLLMHTGIGGYQNYGYGNTDTTGITVAALSGGELDTEKSRNAVLPDNVKNPYMYGQEFYDQLDMRDMVVHPNGTVYILAYNLAGDGGGSTLAVYKTTVTNLYSTNPKNWECIIDKATTPSGESASAWFNKLYAEYYTKRLWAEFGDNVVVYKDGATTPSVSWSAKELGGYNTFNSVTFMPADYVYGNTAVLTTSREEGLTSPSVTTTKVVNENATTKKPDYRSRITGTDADTDYQSAGATKDNANYTFSKDTTIHLDTGSWTDANKYNNILAAVYAHGAHSSGDDSGDDWGSGSWGGSWGGGYDDEEDYNDMEGNDITIDAKGHTLQLQVRNSIATPVGIYAGGGKKVTIDADKVNVIIMQATNGNSLTNAIMNDAGQSDASTITINGDVNINMQDSYGGNGVAVQKTDRWGEASYASTVSNTIAINGNLTIKGADSDTWGIPLNYDNVYSRFNNAGILTQVQKSRVDVSGTVDMDIYGNGITTNAAGSTVSIGGGVINVPKGMNYGYYTLAAYQGAINVNTGKDGTSVGNKTVQLGGDIFALKTGTINLALTNSDSYLRGIIDNGGTVNLTLQNGASWINTKNNTRYSADSEDFGNGETSRVTKFTGGTTGQEGVIFQKPESGALTIDSYSGDAIVIYEHDASKPTSIQGGDVTITSADSGSNIMLSTDNTGIDMTNTKTVNLVLDALAKKLWYTKYVQGEENLSGKVRIAEGLTAASVAKATATIAFSTKTGQGGLGDTVPDGETPSGDNTVNSKNFVLNKQTWDGNNSGDKVTLQMIRQSKWTGDNSGDSLKVSSENSSWEGSSSGKDAKVTLSLSSWKGDSTGSGLTLTATDSTYEGNISGDGSTVKMKTGSTWTGNSSGAGSEITIGGDASWTGDNTGKNSHIIIETDGAWTGKTDADGVTMTMKKNSEWNLTGVSALQTFEGVNTTAAINMANVATGDITVGTYSGGATLLYGHDAKDPTSIVGGNFTVEKAASGSNITLLTDTTGLDMTNKIAINATLDALAKKLYYKETGGTNLIGTVKIGEGLTAASAAKFTGSVIYDSTTGQGSLDTSSVDYGADFPTTQKETADKFSTKLTGDYVTDKAYRDAGVLPNPDGIYTFSLPSTYLSKGIDVKTDTIVRAGGNNLNIGANISATGCQLTLDNIKLLNYSDSYKILAKDGGKISLQNTQSLSAGVVSAENGSVDLAANTVTLKGNILTSGADSSVNIQSSTGTITYDNSFSRWIKANGGSVTIDAPTVYLNIAGIEAKGNSTVTVKNLFGNNTTSKGNPYVKTLTIEEGSTVDLQFAEKKGFATAYSGDGTLKLAFNGGTYSGAHTGTGTLIASFNGGSWTGKNDGTGSLNATFTNGAKWTQANSGSNATVSLDNSTWSAANSGTNLKLTLQNGATWTGSNTGTGSASLSGASTWTGATTGSDFALTLDGSTWKNTGASSLTSLKSTAGFIDMTNDASGNISIDNYSGDTTVYYKHNAADSTQILGGDITIASAASGSKITLQTDNTGVDMTEEDSINGTLDALAKKLWYTAYKTGQKNLDGTVKIAEGLTSASAVKQTGKIAFDSTTGQGGLDTTTVTPGPKYPDSQERTAFTTQITGVHDTDKEYQKGGVLSHTLDNHIYNFTLDASTVTTSADSIVTAKDTWINVADGKSLTVTANGGAGNAIAVTGGKLSVQGGELTLAGNISATGSGTTVTAKNIKNLTGTVTTGSGATTDLGLLASGVWKNTGTSSVSSFNGTSGSIIEMVDATAGDISIDDYSGDTTVVYKHSASDSTDILGGDIKITSAAAGSKITLLTDVSGVDTTDEDSLYGTLNALAQKLWYTDYVFDERNLTGTVKIAEGLTSPYAIMQTGNILFDDTTGQGSLDEKSVTPGPKYPDSQDRSAFTTTITGDHTTDKEYRKSGVLSNTLDNNIYNFTKEATTITTSAASVTTAKDTKIDLHGNSLAITSTGGNALAPTGGTLTVTGGGSLTVTPQNNNAYALYAKDAKITIDVDHLTVSKGKVLSEGTGSLITLKHIDQLPYSVMLKNGGSVDLTFNEGGTWKGDISASGTPGTAKVSMTKGTWTGKNGITGADITLDETKWSGGNIAAGSKAKITLKNGSTWTSSNLGAESIINLDNSTWSGVNGNASNKTTGQKSVISLTNGAKWTNANYANGTTVNVTNSSWTGKDTGEGSSVRVSGKGSWEGDAAAKNITVDLKEESAWTGDILQAAEGTSVTADKSTWTGEVGASGSINLTNGSIWNGTTSYVAAQKYSSETGQMENVLYTLDLSLDGSTWNRVGTSMTPNLTLNFTGNNGIVDMRNSNDNLTISNYSGSTTFLYAHDESDPTNVYGGDVTITQATKGSSVTLVTDPSGIDMESEESLFGALDALAKKLYFTMAAGWADQDVLTGTVQIGEGLTRASAMQTASIVFDQATGQGGLDVTTVTPGPNYPEAQTKESYSTSITGDYTKDAEYRRTGVLDGMNETHTYNFTKDATTITTEEATVATSTDTTIDVHDHDLAVKSTESDAVNVTGGTLTVQNGRILSFEGENAVKATNGNVNIIGESVSLTGNVTADNGIITIKKIKDLTGDVTTKDGTADLTFTTGSDWTGDAAGDVTVSMNQGTWTGDNTGTLNATLTGGTKWSGDNSGELTATVSGGSTWEGDNAGTLDATFSDKSTWTGDNTGDLKVTLTGQSTWNGKNAATAAEVNLDNSTWSGNNGGLSATIDLKNGATWTGDNTGDDTAISLDQSTWTGASKAEGTDLTLNSSTWENTGESSVSTLKSTKGILSQQNEASGKVTVGTLDGNLTIQYAHTADKVDDKKTFAVSGGDVEIQSATEGSKVTLLTDRTGIDSSSDRENMENLFAVLVKKLTYSGVTAAPNNLTGSVQIAEGLTRPMAYGEMTFGADGIGMYKDGSLVLADPDILYGDTETAMMRGAKSAMAGTALLWRAEANDLAKRMGELRLSTGETGTWAKYYGGESSYDSQKTTASVKYNAAQVGFDKKVGQNWIVGVAVSHNTGDGSFDRTNFGTATGDIKATSFGVYATRKAENGAYLDIIAKASHLSNDYIVYNDMGHRLEGDYSAMGLSFSAEYGKHFVRDNGLILTPSAELTVGRIGGKTYQAKSDFLDSLGRNKYMHVDQETFTSAVARLAFTVGKNGKNSAIYTKLGLAHEFSGDFKTTFSAENEPTRGTEIDLSGTWLEWQLGGSYKVSEKAYLYGTFEKIFGGKSSGSDWRLDAGLRLSF